MSSVGTVESTDATKAQKIALRDQLVTGRGRRPLVEVSESARAIAAHLLSSGEIRRSATVAAYVSIGTEPGTGPLLDGLLALGRRVIVPVVLPDLDLDWAVYDGPDSLARARRGLLEPTGPRLGLEAVATADVVLTPGLAVDRLGHAARPGRRLLRPGARPGPGRHVHLHAALRRRADRRRTHRGARPAGDRRRHTVRWHHALVTTLSRCPARARA